MTLQRQPAQDRQGYRDELLDAGLLIATGVDGLYGRSGCFEGIVSALEHLVTRAGADQAASVVRFAPVVPRPVFERSDYLRSFPNLTGSVHTFDGDDRAHADLLAVLDDGGDWSAGLSPTEVVLCSAACHPLYPMLTGLLPPGGRRFDVYGWCFRHEPSLDPGRMQAFRQYEFVYVGDPEGATAHRDLWVDRAAEVLVGDLNLDAKAEVANDPFFGRAGRLLSAAQRTEALKYELVCAIGPGEGSTAVVSSNGHKEHFGEAFAITVPGGGVAHSACVGFGMERIVLALLHAHGLDPNGWPSSVRAALWP